MFDGDGSIFASGSDGRPPTLYISVTKALKGIASLYRLKETFGCRQINLQQRATETRQEAWHWRVLGTQALQVARRLVEFTRLKAPQLRLAAEQWPMGRMGKALTAHQRQLRTDIQQRLHAMKDIPHERIKDELPAEYWAGLFDAEGCIKVSRSAGDVSLSLAQKYDSCLNALKAQYNGICRIQNTVTVMDLRLSGKRMGGTLGNL